MGKEIDLLKNYPKQNRDTSSRASKKTEEIRMVARKFGEDFFDGKRDYGYGGFKYNPKYWTGVVKDFKNYYNLNSDSKILDVGCAKGFMVYDFKLLLPDADILGIDISNYAIQNSKEEIRGNLKVGCASELPYEDNYFDLVISINTIHNLDNVKCGKAISEINRVSKKNSYITVDAYRSEVEKIRMYDWNLTAKTIMSTDEWKVFFNDYNYKGDYYWFIP